MPKNKYNIGDVVWTCDISFHATLKETIIGPMTIREVVGGSGNSYICSNPEITLHRLGYTLASSSNEAAQLCKLIQPVKQKREDLNHE